MILEVKDLAFSYHNDPGSMLFRDVNFTLRKGEIFSILGANGAGKSTLLNCLANLLHPAKGQILLNGHSLMQSSLKNIARTIGYVPQSHTPAYAYSVEEFIVMGRAPYLGLCAQPREKDYQLVREAMEELGITHLSDRPYTELSGGERQQVIIARAIVQQPDIIMLDEPTNHLDYGNQLRMMQLIKRLAKKGYGVIITSHMPDHVLLLGGMVGMLGTDGRLQVGSTEEIMTEENLKRLYDIDVHMVYIKEVGRKVCAAGKMEGGSIPGDPAVSRGEKDESNENNERNENN